MKPVIIILMLLMGATQAHAGYTGVVINDTGIVQYKFSDTDALPQLNADESIVLRPDINAIQKDAVYDVNTHAYTNPNKTAVTPSVPVTSSPPIDPNYVIVSGSGLGIAYLIMRRKTA